jgi:hypothetical protein
MDTLCRLLLLLGCNALPSASSASSTPDAPSRPLLTHADWLCYAQRYPEVAKRFGAKTLAIRRYFFSTGRALGHQLVPCADTFTLQPADMASPLQRSKLVDERTDCRGRTYGSLYEHFHAQARERDSRSAACARPLSFPRRAAHTRAAHADCTGICPRAYPRVLLCPLEHLRPAPRRPGLGSAQSAATATPTDRLPLRLAPPSLAIGRAPQGYVVFTPCTLQQDRAIIPQLAAFTAALPVPRFQYARHDTVLRAANDPDTHAMMRFLHDDRIPFPFQTINFVNGTQQAIHSDVPHFDTLPTRGLMAAAWLALEDIHPHSGPLVVYPGSHRIGLWDQAQLGIVPDLPDSRVPKPDGHSHAPPPTAGQERNKSKSAYEVYTATLRQVIAARGLRAQILSGVRRGDIVIWASSLLHGGSPVINASRTRLSQVTHFFFKPAQIFWVPRLSPENRHLQQKHPRQWATLEEWARARRGSRRRV